MNTKQIYKLDKPFNDIELVNIKGNLMVISLSTPPGLDDYYLDKPSFVGRRVYHDGSAYLHTYKVLFADAKLKFKNVPVIEDNTIFNFNRQQLRFLFDTSFHATIGELNQDEEFEKVLTFLSKQAQQNLFTEEQVREAIQLAREADSIDGVVDLPVVLNFPGADNSDLQIKWSENEIIQSLKQPKVEIEFDENGSPIKCTLL